MLDFLGRHIVKVVVLTLVGIIALAVMGAMKEAGAGYPKETSQAVALVYEGRYTKPFAVREDGHFCLVDLKTSAMIAAALDRDEKPVVTCRLRPE